MGKKTPSKKRQLARIHDHHVVIEGNDTVMVCEKNHHEVPLEAAEVPYNQKAPFRHLCAGCTYEMGYQHGYDAALKALQQAAPPASKY